MLSPVDADAQRRSVVAGLLAQTGYRGDFEVCPCGAGGNNQVRRVLGPEETYVAKWYVNDPGDGRDRLTSEWEFLSAADLAGIGRVPRPVARDTASGAALYTFVDGEQPTARDVDRGGVVSAVAFIRDLNRPATRNHTSHLGPASEACFSADEHFQLVGGRIDRLSDAVGFDRSARRAASLVAELRALFHDFVAQISSALPAAGFPASVRLAKEQRVLSPSDFGFHNAIRTPDGEYVFIDFEYAGWDDPAKLWADGFYQPRFPLPRRFEQDLLDGALSHLPRDDDREAHAIRCRLLRRVFGLKWVCIILNPFLPGWLERRSMDSPVPDLATVKDERLHKARKALTALTEDTS